MMDNRLQANEAMSATPNETISGYETIEFTEGPNGYRLNPPVSIRLPRNLNPGERDVFDYLIWSLLECTPRLAPWACKNRSIVELARYLKRSGSSSKHTIRNYVWGARIYSEWAGCEPDELISACKTREGFPNLHKLNEQVQKLDDLIGYLQSKGLAPCTIRTYVKAVRMLFEVNGLELRLPYKLRKRVQYEDRAPTPDELQRLIDLADLRGKIIVSMLALGGFRTGTLVKLRYQHIKEDFERGIIPVHVHVESDITKGKYHSYDTFLGKEAVDYLRAYLDGRRRGTWYRRLNDERLAEYELRVRMGEPAKLVREDLRIDWMRGLPPERITDESPLIRDAHSVIPKPITPKQVHSIVSRLYRRAGLIPKYTGEQRRYELRAHSIRKFFRTQLAALGINSDYIEYMMGHTISTYHDIRMKGIEFLRNIYAASGLSIAPKTTLSRTEALKTIIRAFGMDPDRVLVKEALSQPHRIIVGREGDQLQVLGHVLRELVQRELLKLKRGGESSCLSRAFHGM